MTRSGSGYELKVRISDLEGGTLAEGARSAPDEERLLPAVTALAGELATRLLGPGAVQTVGSQATFEDRLNVLTVGPILFAFGFYGLEYERVLTDLFSVFVVPQWLNATAASGFEVTGGARVYLFGEAPRGLYVGAYAVGGVGAAGPGFGLGGELGFQWLLGDRVALALGYGHGWRAVQGYLTHQGVFPQVNRVRVQLGVAF
ncbi:MAG: hypothetical protein M3Y59_21865 [Myxococcota bacterium]|nr:hypothetical protein [Myxococcota bacterium]